MALAPVGLTGMQHADGEILAAKACEKFGVPFTLSTMSICSIEDVREHTSKPFWFQLYVMRDREFSKNLIGRAKAAGCSALVLTVDLQILGQRHKDVKNGLSAPPKPTIANIINLMTKPRWCMGMLGTRRRTFRNIVGHAKGVGDMSSLASWTAEQFDPKLNWKDLEWIKNEWGGKLILAMLVIGFFIALIGAWAYELTPEGVKRDSEVDPARPTSTPTRPTTGWPTPAGATTAPRWGSRSCRPTIRSTCGAACPGRG